MTQASRFLKSGSSTMNQPLNEATNPLIKGS